MIRFRPTHWMERSAYLPINGTIQPPTHGLWRLLRISGVALRPSKPTLNIDHIQWMVKEGVCYSLMRASRPLMNGLVTRPIDGVDWTIDTAFVTKSKHENPVLSWFVEELVKHQNVT